MDSRLIYAAANSMKSRIDWEKSSQTKWSYVGLHDELKIELILNEIKAIFNTQNMYLVLGRTDSLEITIVNVREEIVKRMGKEDFLICDTKFSKFIAFNKIGVIRIETK